MNIIYILLIILLLSVIFYFFYFRNENYCNNLLTSANDVSDLNNTQIFETINIHNKEDIINSIKKARQNGLTIGMCGTKHSMGGHSISKGGLRLDMKYFNNIIKLDREKSVVIVQPGLLWCDLIKYLNQFGLSPITLQSYSSFSIGGSISVNGHGITNDNTLADSIEQIKIIDCDGEEIICDNEQNNELFSLVIGGYGLFGVITEITLKVTKNVKLNVKKYILNSDNFCDKYDEINKDQSLNIKLARIDITNMKNIYLYCFNNKNDNKNNSKNDPIISSLSTDPNKMSRSAQFMYKWLLPSRLFQKLRFNIEKSSNKPIDMNYDLIDRNQLLYESAEPLSKLYNVFIDLNRTHILQEFFIPKKYFEKWMQFLSEYMQKRLFLNVTLLNITIRFVKKDNISFLKYAKDDMYAFVFYYRISKNNEGDNEIKNINLDLTDEAIKLKGTFYLPYRHHYMQYQLMRSYPEIIKFIYFKRKYDSNEIFTNLWYDWIKIVLKIEI